MYFLDDSRASAAYFLKAFGIKLHVFITLGSAIQQTWILPDTAVLY